MPLKNAKAKGARAERRTMRVLEACGYYCLKAGGSLGIFDVVAIGLGDLRCIQVKSGATYCSAVERECMELLELPSWASKEIWRWPDRAKEPRIERLAPGRHGAPGDPATGSDMLPSDTPAGAPR